MNTTSQPAVRGERVRPRADDVSSHREAIAAATAREVAPRGFVLVLPELPLPELTREVEGEEKASLVPLGKAVALALAKSESELGSFFTCLPLPLPSLLSKSESELGPLCSKCGGGGCDGCCGIRRTRGPSDRLVNRTGSRSAATADRLVNRTSSRSAATTDRLVNRCAAATAARFFLPGKGLPM